VRAARHGASLWPRRPSSPSVIPVWIQPHTRAIRLHASPQPSCFARSRAKERDLGVVEHPSMNDPTRVPAHGHDCVERRFVDEHLLDVPDRGAVADDPEPPSPNRGLTLPMDGQLSRRRLTQQFPEGTRRQNLNGDTPVNGQ
jgi:hypothetical protein